MALTVEDGTGVANADSYVTLVDARAYAVSRGLTLNATDAVAEVQLRKSFDYIESFRDRFKGIKAEIGQVTQWPRYGATLDGETIEITVIPTAVQYAQVYAAAAIESGLDIMPNASGSSFVVREKVGPIETTYSEGVSTSGIPILRVFNTLIAPLLTTTGALSVERA